MWCLWNELFRISQVFYWLNELALKWLIRHLVSLALAFTFFAPLIPSKSPLPPYWPPPAPNLFVCTFFYVYVRITMCDFLDFGLTFFSIMCIQVVARLPQRLKSTFFERLKLTFFEIFSSLRWPLRSRSVRKNFKKRWF